MGFDDRAADREPHAHAIGLGRIEGVEQAVEIVGTETRPGISHLDQHVMRMKCSYHFALRKIGSIQFSMTSPIAGTCVARSVSSGKAP
jgi:hypothetical protein